MSRSLPLVIIGAAALGCALLFPSPSHAQNMNWGGDAYWSSFRGVYTPYGGATVSQRLSDSVFFPWAAFGPNWDVVYAIDRQERFEKFGTRYGPDHPPLFNRILQRHR